MKNGAKKLLIMAFCVILALFSIFGASKWASAPENHRETIQYLDDRRTAVLELAGASTAASIAITVSPGDIGTPIANKLADLSSYFLLIVSALVLEKYLVTITGYVAFTFLIPIAFIAYYPSLAILEPDNIPLLTILAPVIGVFFFWLSYKFWMFGVKKYDFTGS